MEALQDYNINPLIYSIKYITTCSKSWKHNPQSLSITLNFLLIMSEMVASVEY